MAQQQAPSGGRRGSWQALALAVARRVPLVVGALVALVGLANVLYALGAFSHGRAGDVVRPLDDTLAGGFEALGRSAQLGLGGALAVVGVGLTRRLRSAWAFALLLLTVMLGANVFIGNTRDAAALGLPGVALLLVLVLTRRAYARQGLAANWVLASVTLLAVVAYATVGALVLGRGFTPPIRDTETALYFAIATLATVGYGDIVPHTGSARVFSMTVIVMGLAAFATTLGSTLGASLQESLRRALKSEGVPMTMRDHVILVGTGSIASNAAEELGRRSVALVRVVPDAATAEGEHLVHGDAADDDVLERAGIRHARLLIAAGEDDSENAMITLAAKDLNPAVRVLAVAGNPAHIQRLKRARADVVFAPATVGGRLLAALAEGRTVEAEFQDLVSGEL